MSNPNKRHILLGVVGIFLQMLSPILQAQMSDSEIQQMTQTSFANFKANKWHHFGDYWGWQTKDGREGLWWRVDNSRYKDYDHEGKNGKSFEAKEVKNQDFYKSPPAVSPHATTGAMIYDFTGKREYLEKAIKLWEWEINNLWACSDDSGIYEGQNFAREAMNGWEAVRTVG